MREWIWKPRRTARWLLVTWVTICGVGGTASMGAESSVGAASSMAGETAALRDWLVLLPTRSSDRLISGQHLGFGDAVADGYRRYVTTLHESTGRWVALVGADYGYGRRWDESQGTWDLIGKVNPTLIQHYDNGGLVMVSWHAPNPWTRQSAWDNSGPVDLSALVQAGNPMRAVWEADLDRIAAALADLQDAGVVVLWRPFHESTGGWFWWGTRSHPDDPEPFVQLWRHMYDYFTRVWGLDNLLWVYAAAEPGLANTIAADANYPGDDVVDIVGESHYQVGNKMRVNPEGYAALTALGKPYMLTEFGPSLQQPPGTYRYVRLARRVRKRFPLTIGWYSWGDGASGDARRAIVSNKAPRRLFKHRWVLDGEELDWRQ